MAESLAAISTSSALLQSRGVSGTIHDSRIDSSNRVTQLVRPRLTGLQRRGLTQLRISEPAHTHRTSSKYFVTPCAIAGTDTGTSFATIASPQSPSTVKSPRSPSDQSAKGWKDEWGREDPRLLAQLRNIAFAAEDRSEMHAIIGTQRDNWNKLCHTTVTMTAIAAAMLAAMNGTEKDLSMSLAAFLLNSGTAGIMLLMSKFQPSQLAEEQRTAARFFKMLAKDIETTLRIEPRLREHAQLYLDAKIARLEALDNAFPLPLIPNGLEKFPETVRPSVLSPEVDLTKPEIPANYSNGWTEKITDDLRYAAEKIKTSDIETYLGWARKNERENKRLAIAAPSLTAAAAVFSMLELMPGMHVSCVAAACSILATFASTFSHAGQIGMIFEMYRNCAGAFADMDNSVQRTLRLPIDHREDAALFHQKIALRLGRRDQMPLVNVEDKIAGKLF